MDGLSILLIIVFAFFFLGGGIVTVVFLIRAKYKFKITILEKVPPFGYIPTIRDRARLVSFGDGGEEVYYLKKLKRYKIGYGKKIGKNAIAWAIGEDGYWYNVGFQDLDTKLREIGITPVDRNMRFATSSLRKGIESRYNQKTFLEKWGVPITIGLLIVAIIIQGVSTYYQLSKQKEISLSTLESTKVSKEVMELASKVLTSVDNIKSGGQLTPVTSVTT